MFDRPKAINAISLRMFAELAELLTQAAADDAVRCVVLRGAGANFSSGADIKEPIPSAAALLADPIERHPTYLLRTMPKPTLAAISGYCLGGALELALAADIRLAATDAIFGFAEIDWALTTGWGGATLLEALVGRGQALRLLLTGRRIAADEALSLRVVEEVVDTTTFEERVGELATHLADAPRDAVAGFRALMDNTAFTVRLQRERETFAHVAHTPQAEALLAEFGRGRKD